MRKLDAQSGIFPDPFDRSTYREFFNPFITFNQISKSRFGGLVEGD